ncbi:hypothetical protein P7H21_09640 [Paenibacillus larvae]|nr:hypothetical protein [Paenibacillus larvae]MDT2304172.1 hypothetical protein [Paenibacillus larvae]
MNLQSSKEDLQKYYDDLAQLQKKLTFFDWDEFKNFFDNFDLNLDFSELNKSFEELTEWSVVRGYY